MTAFFTAIIYQPLLNLTVLLYTTAGFHDLGLTIVLMTVVIRLLMLPLSLKAARSQRMLAAINPEIEKIRKQNKDSTAQSAALMQLYKDRGIHPLSGCLPLLIQLPLLIGLYRVFMNVFKPDALELLYSFIPHPGIIQHLSFGFIDTAMPGHILAILAGVLQFVQAWMALSLQPQTAQTAAMSKQMAFLLPVMIIVIGWSVPVGLVLYWITTTVFSIGEQLYLRRQYAILSP